MKLLESQSSIYCNDCNEMINFYLILILSSLRYLYAREYEEMPCNALHDALYIHPSKDTNKEEESTPLCPIQPKDTVNNLNMHSNQHDKLEYCLYEKSSVEGKKNVCKYEVKPVLYSVRDGNNQRVRCGTKNTQFLHKFGYLHCTKMIKPKLDHSSKKSGVWFSLNGIIIGYIPTYTLCYDIFTHQTIWTKHQIMTPFIFINPEYEEEPYCPTQISTEPFYPKSEKYFLKLEYEYNQEKINPITNFPIIPHRMVPAEHFAFRMWKKTTNHYVNVAPLWNKLEDLMTAIDEGIKNSAIVALFKSAGSEELHPGFIIYTAIKPFFSLHDRLTKWILRDKDYFIPNIWVKFVYDPKKKQGVMIYIRNRPGIPFKDKKKKKKNLCHFKEWIDNKEIRDRISLYVLEPYAYCKKVSSKEIEKIFSISVELEEQVLDIDNLSKSYFLLRKS